MLAIGLVVDDAIVVVEAVEHHIEQGMTPHDATVKAMEEVSGPVIAIALILAAVFIPTAFVPGITGQLYKQFAVTIAVSVTVLGVQRADAQPGAVGHAAAAEERIAWSAGRVLPLVQQVFGRATDGYVTGCKHLIHKAGFAFILLGSSWWARGSSASAFRKAFLPDEDQGYLYAGLQLPDASSLQRSSEAARDGREESS